MIKYVKYIVGNPSSEQGCLSRLMQIKQAQNHLFDRFGSGAANIPAAVKNAFDSENKYES